MASLIDQVKAARQVSTPIVAVTTPDQPAVVETLRKAFSAKAPIVMWDRARGMVALNDTGVVSLTSVAKAIGVSAEEMPTATADAAAAMRYAINLDKHTIFMALTMDRFLREHQAGELIQAVLNLRDAFKTDQRTLILLSPDFDWPIELQHDVIVFDDPLPSNGEYAVIANEILKAASLPEMKEKEADKVALSVRGLSAFEAEQVLAMSLAMSKTKKAIDVEQAWEFKRRAVGKVKGLTMTLDGPDLSDLRGLDQITLTLKDLWLGPEPPELVVRVDEIDKGLAGLGARGGVGDNTGISQDLHQQFLTSMEDNGWTGAILVGVRGSGKTVLTQSIGKAHGVPTIAMDTGRMKGSLVGQSEQAFRDAFRTIKSIGGSRVCVLATCNRLDVLPPELLRRFKLQIWFFDVMSKEERESLWPVYLKKYGHPLDTELPTDIGWTGSEIRNCCEIAYRLNKPVKTIGEQYIVPITKSDPQSIKDLRAQAEGRFLSAAKPGPYRTPAPETMSVSTPMARKLNLGN